MKISVERSELLHLVRNYTVSIAGVIMKCKKHKSYDDLFSTMEFLSLKFEKDIDDLVGDSDDKPETI